MSRQVPPEDPWWTPAVRVGVPPTQPGQDGPGPARPHAGGANPKGVAAVALAVILATLAVGALVRTAGRGARPAGDAALPVATTGPPVANEPPASAAQPASIGGVGSSASILRNGAPLGSITLAGLRTAIRQPGNLAATPRNGLFLVMTVQLTAVGDGFGAGPPDFYVRSPDGTRHQSTATASQPWGPELGATSATGGPLRRGGEHQGVMVFDVPHLHGELVYAPLADGRRPVATWRF